MRTFIYYFLMVLLFKCVSTLSANERYSWWPKQQRPDYVVKCKLIHMNSVPEQNLAQSLCGLAAQALNEGISNEGLWTQNTIPIYKSYFKDWKQRLDIIDKGEKDIWDISADYNQKGIVKGYILYDYNRKDNSINLATVMAGLKKGILIDKTLEYKAKELGLKKLFDACSDTITKEWFESHKSELNNNLICITNPSISNNRDYAIAHKSMVYFGVDALLDTILEWVEPLSPVIGWNSGPEFQHIAPCSNWGLINTASDWCSNLSMLTITGNEGKYKIKTTKPSTLTLNDDVIYHSFVMSDGDNMQWTFGTFIDNPDYWASEYNNKIPMSFTSCLVNLSMAAPDVLNQLIKSKPRKVSLVEYGGGYYYPDLFASKRGNRPELLRKFAKIVNEHIQYLGVNVFGFICKQIDSEESREAYKIFAEELTEIAGMIAVQYAPYNGGQGKVYWVKNKKGIDIPVISCREQLWSNLQIEKSGSPADIAKSINLDADNKNVDGRFAWTIVHAWSRFEKDASGFIKSAPQESKFPRGVTPTYWCAKQLNNNVKVVPIDELIWLLRMAHSERK